MKHALAKKYNDKIWTKKGTRPRVESAHIYGAVCPATGRTEVIIPPCLSKDVM